jgi:SnoaL-like domain
MQPLHKDNAILLSLPRPVATYLAAVKAKDTQMLVLCFADDARVHDENRDYQGLDAIRAWKQETDAKYRYVMEPLDASVSENTVKLRARLTGDFPGSPVELDYTFMLARDKISSLEIQ